MRVKIKTWRGQRETELEDALTPSIGAYECEGQLERAESLARKSAEAFGRLAALLVERRLISLDEAVSASGVSEEITEV